MIFVMYIVGTSGKFFPRIVIFLKIIRCPRRDKKLPYSIAKVYLFIYYFPDITIPL